MTWTSFKRILLLDFWISGWFRALPVSPRDRLLWISLCKPSRLVWLSVRIGPRIGWGGHWIGCLTNSRRGSHSRSSHGGHHLTPGPSPFPTAAEYDHQNCDDAPDTNDATDHNTSNPTGIRVPVVPAAVSVIPGTTTPGCTIECSLAKPFIAVVLCASLTSKYTDYKT